MQIYYPLDKNGNQIGFRTPESYIYDETGKNLTDKIAEMNSNISTYNSHVSNKNNPHEVTKEQIGLGNVDNTADSAKSVNYATTAGTAASATKATQDASGNVITTTYTTKAEATALGNQISTVDSNLSVLSKSSNPLYEALKTVVSDHYLDSNGVFTTNPTGTYICSSETYVDISRYGFIVKISSAYQFQYCEYDSNLTATAITEWLSGECFLPLGKIRIAFRKVDGTSISVSEARGSIEVYDDAPIYDAHLTPMLLGDGYVDFDSITTTMSIPGDTLLVKADMPAKYIQISGERIYVNYGSVTSSAVKFVYNINERTITAHRYNDTFTDPSNHLLIAVIRSPHTARTREFKVSINAPYSIDGVPYGIKNSMPNSNMKSICHRGYNALAPENTLSAFRMAKFFGFNYVETDILFTSDEVPVCLHDITIDRTSNATGAINSLTYEYVRTLDFGSYKSEKYAGEKIPSLEEFIRLCRNLGLHPYIELKADGSYTQERATKCMNIVKRAGMLRNVTWISFAPEYLTLMKTADPSARLGILVENINETNINAVKALQTTTNEVFLNVRYDNITSATIELAVANNIPVEGWTVDVVDDINNMD